MQNCHNFEIFSRIRGGNRRSDFRENNNEHKIRIQGIAIPKSQKSQKLSQAKKRQITDFSLLS
jgi:hypothetical protein